MCGEVTAKYRSVAQFLQLFAETIPFGSTTAGEPVLTAFSRIGDDGADPSARYNVVESVITVSWRPFVFSDDGYDHRAYVLCVLEALHVALKRRDTYVESCRKWGDPRARLLDGPAWARVRPTMLTALRLSDDPERHITDLAGRINTGFTQLADRLSVVDGPARIETSDDGRVRLHFDRLEAIPKPESLVELDKLVIAMLPRVDLPELLMDIHARTGFLDDFHHQARTGDEMGTRLDDLAVSLAAVFIVEGCNLGYAPVVKRGHPALTRNRLSHVNQNYVRAETITAANARLINAQATIPTAQVWGGGSVASVDGLRFVVPVRTLDAGPNPR